jgi:hypothetical protein
LLRHRLGAGRSWRSLRRCLSGLLRPLLRLLLRLLLGLLLGPLLCQLLRLLLRLLARLAGLAGLAGRCSALPHLARLDGHGAQVGLHGLVLLASRCQLLLQRLALRRRAGRQAAVLGRRLELRLGIADLPLHAEEDVLELLGRESRPLPAGGRTGPWRRARRLGASSGRPRRRRRPGRRPGTLLLRLRSRCGAAGLGGTRCGGTLLALRATGLRELLRHECADL